MTTPKVKPLGKRVLVKRADAMVSKKGILLPDSAQEKPKQGEVVAIGPGSYDQDGKLVKVELKVGDKVLFSSYSGTEVKTSNLTTDSNYLIMSEDDVLAVIEA